ncbi:hypothetical protein [Cellulomonas hominis]
MRKKRSVVVGAALAGLVALGTPASAAVSSIAISPTSQTINSGTTAVWGWSWGGTGTYAPKFTYGDGTSRTYASQTNGGSGSASKTFDSCSGAQYTQRIAVSTSSATATTRVNAGPCR